MEKSDWFMRLLDNLFSNADDVLPVSTPDSMIRDAAQRAFRISTTLGLLPGPVGLAATLPEIVALTRLQIRLISRIARYYHKEEMVNRELVLLVFGNAMGIAVGELFIKKMGANLVIKSVQTSLARSVARKIGSRIVNRAAERAIGRWIPMVLAPVFGYFSRSMTQKIGKEATMLFAGNISTETRAT